MNKALLVLMCCFLYGFSAFADDSIARVSEVFGKIKIVHLEKDNKKKDGEKKLLQNNDYVVTGPDSKATVTYNDGTILRIFENSKVQVREKKGILNVLLRRGALWANVIKKKNRDRFRIRTAAAVIGIKGTNLAVSSGKNTGTGISVSEGNIEVLNKSGVTPMKAGEMATGVMKDTAFEHKIHPIPYKIEIKPLADNIDISKTQEVVVEIKLIDRNTNQIVSHRGTVYLSVNQQNQKYTHRVSLGSKGITKTKIRLAPPSGAQSQQWQLEILAVMEDKMDVMAGSAVVNYSDPNYNYEVKSLRDL